MATVERDKASEITAEIKAAIEDIFRKHGMAEPTCRTGYGDVYQLKIESSPVELGAGGVNLKSQEAQYYTKFGFGDVVSGKAVTLTAPLGTTFESRGETYVFGGIAAKRRKYPIVGINVDTGTTTLFTTVLIERLNAAAK